jgi:hypothetical protein
MKRVKVLFKINNEVVVEETGEYNTTEIEKFKWNVVQECEVFYDDIETEIIELDEDLSEFDISTEGMQSYKDTEFVIKIGVSLPFEIGSDAYLDAMNEGTLEDNLIFI